MLRSMSFKIDAKPSETSWVMAHCAAATISSEVGSSATMSISQVVRATAPVRIRAEPPHTTISIDSAPFCRRRMETVSRVLSSCVESSP